MSSFRIVVNQPSWGRAPSGFNRLHVELPPKEVARLVGYDPRVLVTKPDTGRARRITRELVPHNVSPQLVALQNQVQRSIDPSRVAAEVEYLRAAVEDGEFGAWSTIELVTTSEPKAIQGDGAELDSDAEYFLADGQHRYCALLDFIRAYPQHADKFTQGLTISVLPMERLVSWSGQMFHDMNYFAVQVRPGKALTVDSRDPVNAMAKGLDAHPEIQRAGGIAYDRETLIKGDRRFATHSNMHRFVRGFSMGRPGIDAKSGDARTDLDDNLRQNLWDYLGKLAGIMPWAAPDREDFLTRSSVVLTGLSVVGYDLYYGMGADMTPEQRLTKLARLTSVDWRRTNLGLSGVVGSEKDGVIQPASSRPVIDATIRYLREVMGLIPPKPLPPGDS